MFESNFEFKIWFPGLEDEKPAHIKWCASDVEEAYRQLLSEFPDCQIVGVPN